MTCDVVENGCMIFDLNCWQRRIELQLDIRPLSSTYDFQIGLFMESRSNHEHGMLQDNRHSLSIHDRGIRSQILLEMDPRPRFS